MQTCENVFVHVNLYVSLIVIMDAPKYSIYLELVSFPK
jgi:hypothetical protein